MVYLDSIKIMECIDVESITSETITLNIDGEKLRNEIYQDLKIELKDGKLADIAPTMLTLMGLPVPSEMTGECLIK